MHCVGNARDGSFQSLHARTPLTVKYSIARVLSSSECQLVLNRLRSNRGKTGRNFLRLDRWLHAATVCRQLGRRQTVAHLQRTICTIEPEDVEGVGLHVDVDVDCGTAVGRGCSASDGGDGCALAGADGIEGHDSDVTPSIAPSTSSSALAPKTAPITYQTTSPSTLQPPPSPPLAPPSTHPPQYSPNPAYASLPLQGLESWPYGRMINLEYPGQSDDRFFVSFFFVI